MKKTLSLLALVTSMYASQYEACAPTKKEALIELSGNIKSNIQNNFEEKTTVSGEDDVQTKISSYINTSTNLSLVNIKYKDKKGNICASVDKEEQIANTKVLLDKVMLFDKNNLPTNINEKIKKLSEWLTDIKQVNFLLPVFLENPKKSQAKLNKKEKLFTDLYTQSIIKSNTLVFKSCKDTREKAKISLNNELFKSKSEEDKKGFFDSITSIFKSDEPLMIDIFKEHISYIKDNNKECAIIKKDKLLEIANRLYNDSARISEKSLDKNPKKRYKQIDKYFQQLNVAKALLKVYPDQFKDREFNKLNNIKKMLSNIKKTTYPQFVRFSVEGGKNIIIKIDSKIVKNNEEVYLPDGTHTYYITAEGKCPLKDTFSTSLFDDKTISEDFTSMNYPTILFISDKTPNISLDGKKVEANIQTSIKKCNGEVRYIATYQGQTRDGMIELNAGETKTQSLFFLSSQELAIYNDAKTKNFSTTSGIKYSDSLTPLASDKLEFLVDDDVEHGSLSLDERGSFKYQSDEDYIGVDSFEYVIKTDNKKSAPKVVNITITESIAPKKIAPVIPVEVKSDLNTTKNKIEKKVADKVDDIKKEVKQTVKKEVVDKISDEDKKIAEQRYQKFKIYVDSQEQNIEKLKKLQKKYPKMFQRLLEEKTAH